MPEQHSPPVLPRTLRTRVAVPLEQPPSKSSLIPSDVLQAVALQDDEPEIEGLDEITGEEPFIEAPVLGSKQAEFGVAWAALGQVPLFQGLPVTTRKALAMGARQLELPRGEFLFKEGNAANSLYVVLSGGLELVRSKDGRETVLRQAHTGEAVGLLGLLSARLRTASARAVKNCSIIEIDAVHLQEALLTDELLNQRLLNSYRERLVAGFMASRLFQDIDSIARTRLAGRFRFREIEPNEVLLHPGEVTNLLSIVTHGRLVLENRNQLGQAPEEFEVTQGQFLAITSALSGFPSKLLVRAAEFTTLSVLTHKELNELMREYPALRYLPSRLPQHSHALDRDVYCGNTSVLGL